MKVISCDLHDYFEIVCMRQSKIKIDLSGISTDGVALDIVVKENGENILIETKDGQKLIPLADIDKLESTGNPIESHNFIVNIK